MSLANIYRILTLLLLGFPVVLSANSQFEEGLEQLQQRSFSQKEAAITTRANSGDARSERLLTALMQGKLYLYKADKALVYHLEEGDEGSLTESVLSGQPLPPLSKRALQRVTINNNMRGEIRTALAQMRLQNPDSQIRLAAVKALYSDLDSTLVSELRRLEAQEMHREVKQALTVALAIADLNGKELPQQLAAIETLAGSLEPEVRNRLLQLSESEVVELQQAAERALKRIDQQRQIYANIETLFFGISLGSVLVLAAIGLAITFGVMGVINMAHGELIMLGAYTSWFLQQLMPNAIGTALILAIPAAFLVSGLVGIAIERGVIRHLYGRPLETLLATFGISLVLQQLVRTLISPQNVPVSNPEWLAGSIEINSVLSLTMNRVAIILFSLLVFAALFYVLKKSVLGLQVRAVAQNRAMAQAMGVRSGRVDALTFGLGSGIAGIAGVALSQLTNVGPNLGQAYIIDSFMVVVFGGVGNLWGTLVAGMSLGVVNKFMEPWAGAVLAKILVLVFIILFIQKRPRGLFPQKGRAVEG
ncbi:urea ABC transporter permease subunit UrtB [Ectothiorhodospiraceae bacterium BW-2]|nr:urea ABC transporter permease subunit UrtB [Ectothiorhodospiraceae bacterium BW-2]